MGGQGSQTGQSFHALALFLNKLLFLRFSSTIARTMATNTANKEAFAVIATGGKQYIVSVGDTLLVELLGEHKGPKLTIVRYKAKSNRDRRIGHRQHYAKIKIESI